MTGVASCDDAIPDIFIKFFKAAQKCYSTETYFNPVEHVTQGMLCWKKHVRCFCGFRLVDDLFCFWENTGCVILSMRMTSSMKWPIKSYFHLCLSFMKWVIPQSIQLFFCYSESSGQKKKIIIIISSENFHYQKNRPIVLLISLQVLCCCRVWIHTMLFLSMSDSSSVSIQQWHSCWEGLSD